MQIIPYQAKHKWSSLLLYKSNHSIWTIQVSRATVNLSREMAPILRASQSEYHL